MKQFLTFAVLLITVSFAQPLFAQDAGGRAKKKMKKEAVTASMVQTDAGMTMAYTPTYSSRFSAGNPALSKIVLDLYKMYELNKAPDRSFFADTVMATFTQGEILKGFDQVMSAIVNIRNGISDVKTEIIAITPLREDNTGDDWVLVWGNTTIEVNGPVTTNFHSLWRFNKDGKVDAMHFFDRKVL